MTALRAVKLPFSGKEIRQDAFAQGASLASQMLVDCALATMPPEGRLQVLELGSGSGVVSILCALHRPLWNITGIELQPHLVKLARENASQCELSIRFELMDLREYSGEYDLILANPPWQKLGSGRPSPHHAKNLSRSEISCTLADVLACLKRCLRPAATAILLYPMARQAELVEYSQDFSLRLYTPPQDNSKQYFCAIFT